MVQKKSIKKRKRALVKRALGSASTRLGRGVGIVTKDSYARIEGRKLEEERSTCHGIYFEVKKESVAVSREKGRKAPRKGDNPRRELEKTEGAEMDSHRRDLLPNPKDNEASGAATCVTRTRRGVQDSSPTERCTINVG